MKNAFLFKYSIYIEVNFFHIPSAQDFQKYLWK